MELIYNNAWESARLLSFHLANYELLKLKEKIYVGIFSPLYTKKKQYRYNSPSYIPLPYYSHILEIL